MVGTSKPAEAAAGVAAAVDAVVVGAAAADELVGNYGLVAGCLKTGCDGGGGGVCK